MEGKLSSDLIIHLHSLCSNDGLIKGIYKIRLKARNNSGDLIAYMIPECPKKVSLIGQGTIENDREFVSIELNMHNISSDINNMVCFKVRENFNFEQIVVRVELWKYEKLSSLR